MRGALGFIALGSNEGDRVCHLRAALVGLEAARQVVVLEASPIYESAAHTLGRGDVQPDYLNAVVMVRTMLRAFDLLGLCRCLERAAGRVRRLRWAPRTLDLDLLDLGGQCLSGPELTLPHPRLAVRRFVLQPWTDVLPTHRLGPPHRATVSQLLARCSDDGALRKTKLAWRPVATERAVALDLPSQD